MTKDEENIQEVLDTLSVLSPSPAEAPRHAPQALARLRTEIEAKPHQPILWRFTEMFKRKYALTTVVLLVLFSLAFAFPSVRAAASDFLGLFRVQKFAAISVSPEQLSMLEDIADSGLFPGEIEMIQEPGQPTAVDSLADAESFTKTHVRTLAELGQPDKIYTMAGGNGRLIVNVEDSRRIMEMAGVDPSLIPDSLDGAPVNVTIYDAVSQQWEDITLLQSPSPLVEYPDDVDTAALGEALLRVLGMDSRQARRLARNIDWTNTVLLPVPENIASFSEVEIDGVSGIALNSLNTRDTALMWQKDGIVYLLSGRDVAELIKVADSLQ
ncbi:MAG: hypothetical protein WAM60_04410 [Candidatus Promineifilaceae bacterium]